MQLSQCERLVQGRVVYDNRSGERLVFQSIMKKPPRAGYHSVMCIRPGVRGGERFAYVPIHELSTHPRQYYPLTSAARSP